MESGIGQRTITLWWPGSRGCGMWDKGKEEEKEREGRRGGGGHGRCSGDSGGPDVTGFSKARSP